jgi:hypothetical protein
LRLSKGSKRMLCGSRKFSSFFFWKGNFPFLLFHSPPASIGIPFMSSHAGVNRFSPFLPLSLFPPTSIGETTYPLGCTLWYWEMLWPY